MMWLRYTIAFACAITTVTCKCRHTGIIFSEEGFLTSLVTEVIIKLIFFNDFVIFSYMTVLHQQVCESPLYVGVKLIVFMHLQIEAINYDSRKSLQHQQL